jgi:predicted RNA-binding Zn ribbon-like protein
MAKHRPRKKSSEPELVRRDGAVCVTFVNTASLARRPLETYADLLAWGQQSGTLSGSQAEGLSRLAADDPEAAREVLIRAQTLRGCLLRIFHARLEGQAPADFDVVAIDHQLYEVLAHRRLIADGNGGYRFVWRDGDELDRMLWPVLTSASATLTSRYWRKLRQCAGEGCSLLFLDRSSGSPRKWCSPRACGHRDRARKHYHKTVKPKRERSK